MQPSSFPPYNTAAHVICRRPSLYTISEIRSRWSLRKTAASQSSHGRRAKKWFMRTASMCCLCRSRRQPSREVLRVGLYIVQLFRFALDLIARRFSEKTGATHRSVPVIIHKVVKAGFGDGPSQRVAMLITRALKRDDQIKGPMSHLTYTSRNHPRVFFSNGNADGAFVWMGRKILNHARNVIWILEERVNRFDGSDP